MTDRSPVGAPKIIDFYITLAALGARSLPEEIDDGLLHAWIAATRGESFEIPEKIEAFSNAFDAFCASLQDAKEAAERQAGVELPNSEFQRRVIYLLMHDLSLSLWQACNRVLQAIASGAEVGQEYERRAAYIAAKGQICDWLSECGIEFYSDTPVILPGIVIVSELDIFSQTPDIYFHPAIPENKLKNALQSCCLPPFDWAVALVDCTIFGAADEAVVFGTRGMYYNDGTKAGYIPYSDFPKRAFGIVRGEETQISLGGKEVLDINGSKADVNDLLGVLVKLRQIASDRQKRMQRRELLPAEPRVGESVGLAVYGDDGSILRFEVLVRRGTGVSYPSGRWSPLCERASRRRPSTFVEITAR